MRVKTSIDEAAVATGMSRCSFTRYCERETGRTFSRWKRLVLMQHASERLLGGASVASVAYDVGCENRSAFIAMFKAMRGLSPRQLVHARRLSHEAALRRHYLSSRPRDLTLVRLMSARSRTSTAQVAALLTALVVGAGVSGCDDSVIGRGAGPDGAVLGGEASPQFVDESFDALYPIFLQHKIGQGPKAALWAQRYYRRWVRWTGQIRSFSANGITLRQLKATSTFDVSLWLNNAERKTVAERYKVGDVVTYVGRLDSYDDVWRTLYLINGSVLQRQSPDAGAH